MKITMQFSFESIAEFTAWVSRLRGDAPAVAEVAPAPSEQPVPAAAAEPKVPESVATRMARPRGRPRKNPLPAPQAESAPEPAAPAVVEPTEPASPAKVDVPEAPGAAAPTLDEVKAKLEAVFNKHGFQGAQQLLSAVGVSRLRDATPEMYPVIVAEADKRLA